MTASQTEVEGAVERVSRWANYEFTTEDQIAVKSALVTFTAGDLRLIIADHAALTARIAALEGALGDAVAALASISGLSKPNVDAAIRILAARQSREETGDRT